MKLWSRELRRIWLYVPWEHPGTLLDYGETQKNLLQVKVDIDAAWKLFALFDEIPTEDEWKHVLEACWLIRNFTVEDIGYQTAGGTFPSFIMVKYTALKMALSILPYSWRHLAGTEAKKQNLHSDCNSGDTWKVHWKVCTGGTGTEQYSSILYAGWARWKSRWSRRKDNTHVFWFV